MNTFVCYSFGNYLNSRSPFSRVKSYLKKNSLVARGLTIFDVLQPTSVRVKDPEHIQVIDRYVLAKVWDEVGNERSPVDQFAFSY